MTRRRRTRRRPCTCACRSCAGRWRARSRAGASWSSQAPGYALQAAPDAVDAARFAALIERAQAAADLRARAALLAEALALPRGAALADFADEPFARTAVARWEEQRLAAVEAHAEVRLELGEHDELVAELGELVARHPYRERLRAAHVRALHRSGRTAEALDSIRDLRERLADELGLDPGPELAALHRAVLAGDPAEDPRAAAAHPRQPTSNLPAPVAELIGREHAVRRVRELLTAGRLVTVTGPGGVGKTSVALAVARGLAPAYGGGAWLVDLTAWDGAGDPAEAVLAVLSIPDAPGGGGTPGERLASALGEQRLLLVLDNCEHVAGPVADLVAGLLAAAPGVHVLATSREPLRLRGEARLDLPPLDVPGTDEHERLAASPAVRLFLARSGLAPSPQTVVAVAEVCRRLDGIPLALELAATRAAALGVRELADRLRVPQDRFGLLGAGPRDAPERQRTLAAVIDWSWRLLTAGEQAVLRRLAVHTGGCTLAAAEAVCAGDGVPAGEVLDLLAGLVDRSLVVRGDGGRFRLLESVAAYCLDRLREAGEEPALRRRHARHYLDLAGTAAPQLRGPGQREWLDRLDAEAPNLRAALEEFRREGAAEPALRLALALTWYWFLRGRLGEARRMLAEAAGIPGGAAPALRACAAAWQLGLAIRQGQAAPDQAASALPAADSGAGAVEWAMVAWFLAASVIDAGDAAVTQGLLDRALEGFEAAGDRWGEAAVLSTRAMLAHMRGDHAALERDARRSAALFAEVGDDWGVLQATDWLIGLADLVGDHAEAARLSREGLRIAEELGLWSDVAGRLGWLAWNAVQAGDHHLAQEYAAQSKALSAQQGYLTGEVFATISLAFAARRDGKLDHAEDHLRWLLDTARRQQADEGHPAYLSMVLGELGMLAVQRGDPAAALDWHRQAFAVSAAQSSLRGMVWALEGMAAALALQGRHASAAELLGTAAAAREQAGEPASPSERDELARTTAAVRAGEPRFATLFAHGRTRTPEQAAAYFGT